MTSPTQHTDPATPPPPSHHDHVSRLTQAAALVGIVAGVVIVVAIIFFSGFVTAGIHSDDSDGSGCYRGRTGMMTSGDPDGGYGPGGMMVPPWQQRSPVPPSSPTSPPR